ncbi:MAG: EF-P lysine aminoacylase EpmA [Bdellovibrionia bacterium]
MIETWKSRIQNPRRQRGMKIRSQVENGIRHFFTSQGFLETRTPLLVACPGMEPHIRPFQVQSTLRPDERLYLPTSPEFAMKRLLVGGLEKIFQITPSFRDEPRSPCHRSEFTMLEWYRAQSGFLDIMKDTEDLLEALAIEIHGKPSWSFQGREISVKTPWPRLKVRDLFQKHVGVDLTQAQDRETLAQECVRLRLKPNRDESWDDLYFKIWLNEIEPHLPHHQACFVTHYPASQAALAVTEVDEQGVAWAKRFEAYVGGMELGNAFEELTDPKEQRARFEKDMALREQVYGASFPKNPIDEGFLAALEEGLPPSGGIAVGVDRLVMLYADEGEIDYTFWI